MPELKGQRNGYQCQECRRMIITINLDDGVTPMFLNCRADPGWKSKRCKGLSMSMGYHIDQRSAPEWGWYKPSEEQVRRMDENSRQHYENGGLSIRRLDSLERELYGGPSPRRG